MKLQIKITIALSVAALATFLMLSLGQSGPSVAEFEKRGPHFWVDDQPYYRPHPLHGEIKTFGTKWDKYHFNETGRLVHVTEHDSGIAYEKIEDGFYKYRLRRWADQKNYENGELLEKCELIARHEDFISYVCTTLKSRFRESNVRTIRYEANSGIVTILHNGILYEQLQFNADGQFIAEHRFSFTYFGAINYTNDSGTVKAYEVITENYSYDDKKMAMNRHGRIAYDGPWFARQRFALEEWWYDTRKTPQEEGKREISHIWSRDEKNNPTEIWRENTVKSASTKISYEYW